MWTWNDCLRLMVTGLVLACSAAVASGQDNASAANNAEQQESGPDQKLATIYGQLQTGFSLPPEFDIAKFPVSINEIIRVKPMPLPQNWTDLNAQQRQQWVTAFPDTEEGKTYLAEREAIEKKRHRFPVKLDPDASFVVYDVPPGTYNLFGRQDLHSGTRRYAVEVYGQFEVGDVDEVKMTPVPVELTRILQTGEVVPDFEVDELNGDKKTKLADYAGKPVLVYFWTARSPTAASDAPVLKKMYQALHEDRGLELLAICTDEELISAKEFVSQNEIPWPQTACGGWTHPVFKDYGLPRSRLISSLDQMARSWCPIRTSLSSSKSSGTSPTLSARHSTESCRITTNKPETTRNKLETTRNKLETTRIKPETSRQANSPL